MRNLKSLALLIGFAFLLSGCGTLDPAGPYKGDKALYNADLTIASSYDTIHAFVSWELQNRPALASTPHVTIAADRMRKDAPQWFHTALAMRDAYANTPNDGTLVALNQALAVLHAAAREALNYSITYKGVQ